MKAVRSLLERHRDYHSSEPLMLWYAGLLGTFAFPLFYVLRFTKAAPVYDDLALRLTAAFLCVLLLLRKHWPARMQPWFYDYSYAVLIFTLPFMFVFTSLQNGGGTVAVGNTLMAVFFVIFMTDWRNMLVMLTIGFSAAAGLYVLTNPDPSWPADYVARFPILLLVMVGGSFFKLAVESATARKVRQAYAAIAGSIAHEMRNPFAHIGNSIEKLQKDLPPPGFSAQPLGERQMDSLYRHIGEAEQAVTRGLQVISMTLDQVNDRPFDKTSFSLLEAADTATKALREYGFESHDARDRVGIEVEDNFDYFGDETACLFVLFNLIKNALFYAPAHPDMRVTLHVGKHTIRVRDTGPGIPPAQLESLFEPFRSAGKSEGSGLGLAYCRRVMAAFGGSISCESRQGEYTEFILRFPPIDAQAHETHLRQVTAKARAALMGRRVLLVDDEAAQRAATRLKLAPVQAAIDEAQDGQQALALLNLHAYELVVLDLRMPVMDGYTLAEKIRAGEAPRNRGVRLLAHTSEPTQAARVKARRAGVDALLSKGGPPLALMEALLQPAQARTRHDGIGQAKALDGKTIILADDSAYSRRAVSAYLSSAGASVREAGHGAEVLEHLRTAHADAVVVDLQMPGMGGIETTAAIRASGAAWSRIPVIALTGRSDSPIRDAAQRAGMDAFMVKPVQAEPLYEVLSRVLAQAPAAGERCANKPAHEDSPIGLLNEARLLSYGRMGLLQELLADYLPEIDRLLDELDAATALKDTPRTLDALHSLLGMSGEAGALLLYHKVRDVYVPLLEAGREPAAADWPEDLRRTASMTHDALVAYAAAQPGAKQGGTISSSQ